MNCGVTWNEKGSNHARLKFKDGTADKRDIWGMKTGNEKVKETLSVSKKLRGGWKCDDAWKS